MTTETGGQAFPSNTDLGMTLRDYFASKAMQGLLSNPKLQKEILAQGGCHSGWIETSAWAFADAMLKARQA
jgi:hypothetical protein